MHCISFVSTVPGAGRTVIISNQQYPIPVHHCCTIPHILAASGLFTAWHIPLLFSFYRDYLYSFSQKPGISRLIRYLGHYPKLPSHICLIFHCCGSGRTIATSSFKLRISFDDISLSNYRIIFKISYKYRCRIFFENITRY